LFSIQIAPSDEAAKWYDKAAKQGVAEAAHKLGKLKI
jgi:TPR repeat protein